MKTVNRTNLVLIVTIAAALLAVTGCETEAHRQYMAQQADVARQRAANEQELQERISHLKKGMTFNEVELCIGPVQAKFLHQGKRELSTEGGGYTMIILGPYELLFDSFYSDAKLSSWQRWR